MLRACWNGKVLAQGSDLICHEGVVYFPVGGVDWEFLLPSSHRTWCPLRGIAFWYHLAARGRRRQNSAWCHPYPPRDLGSFRDRVAFVPAVTIERVPIRIPQR